MQSPERDAGLLSGARLWIGNGANRCWSPIVSSLMVSAEVFFWVGAIKEVAVGDERLRLCHVLVKLERKKLER